MIPKIKLNKKPTYIKLSNNLDFFELFKVIERKFDNCFILESLGENIDGSRYSVVGFDPEKIITANGNKLTIGEESFDVKNPYEELKNIFPQDLISRNFSGGLIGYLTYESINYFEPSLNFEKHPKFDQFKFGLYTDGLVHDKITGETFYFFFENDREDIIKDLLFKKANGHNDDLEIERIGHTLTKEEHRKAIEIVKEEIIKGNTFQCEVGFKTEYKIKGNTLPIYESLREINPSPYMYYVKFGDQKIIGASPELLLRLRSGEMETFPLAGTAKRGKDLNEDQTLARELLNNPKEIAEHKMLVDLHRNDLGRVAEFGTVKVRRLLEIKKFSHVQHISSEVAGIIRKGEDMFSALASVLPAGTLSGAPKIESMKIINKLEKKPRGPYGGGLGHFGFNGDCTFAIPIRTLFISGEYAYAQTSGGIVYDSDPDLEYKEIENKLAAMEAALSKFIVKKP